MVEHQPSKLRVAGSNPVSRSSAHVAQAVERVLGKDEVTGPNPVMGSRLNIAVKFCKISNGWSESSVQESITNGDSCWKSIKEQRYQSKKEGVTQNG